MSTSLVLQLPTMLPRERLLARLQSRVTLATQSHRAGTLEFFDSFDRDLWFDERVLYRRDDEMVLAALENLLLARPIASCRLLHDVPGFAAQFPESTLRSEVARHLKLRAILPMIRITATSESLAVKNEDGKTVVRLRLESLAGLDETSGTTLQLCCVERIRGYDRDADDVSEYLCELGLYEADSMAVARVLGELAAVPEQHPGPRLSVFTPSLSSREAVCQFLRDLWVTARSREVGVVENIDTEFLHEYRVALRRIRSLLSLTRGLLPQPLTDELKEHFRRLACVTNQLRDLDVYLVSRESYRQLLPNGLRSGLDPMFADFAARREREHLRLQEWLTSPQYQSSVEQVNGLLDKLERSAGNGSDDPSSQRLASTIIAKRYRKITAQAGKIDRGTSDAELHGLRIACKKLRYALEFFGSLFDEDAISLAVKKLKQLQDALGTFNDLSVQRASLAAYLEQNQSLPGANAALAGSIGGLVGALYQSQIEQRGQVMDEIGEFCSGNMGATFDRICRPTKRAA